MGKGRGCHTLYLWSHFFLSLSQNMIQTQLENRIELNLPWLWTIRMAWNENNNQQSPASQFQITVNNTRLTITVFALSQNNMANGIWTSARQNCPPPRSMPKELTTLALAEPPTHTHKIEYKLLSWVDKTASLRPVLQGEALNCLKVYRWKTTQHLWFLSLVTVLWSRWKMKATIVLPAPCPTAGCCKHAHTQTASTYMVMVTVVVVVV